MTHDAFSRLGHAAAAFPDRAALLTRFAELPNEAWSYVVMAAASGIWPDEIGGFSEESQDAITEVRATAKVALGE